MKINSLALEPGEHGVILGPTGSGKSVLAGNLINNALNNGRKVAIIDPKGKFDNVRLPVINSKNKFDSYVNESKSFIFRPSDKDLDNASMWDYIYLALYKNSKATNRGYMVYTDDVVGIIDSHNYPTYYLRGYQMGRGLGMSMLSIGQRPTGFPLATITDSVKRYAFSSKFLDDVKRIKPVVGGYDISTLPEYNFVFFNDRTQQILGPLKIKLSKQELSRRS